MKNRIVIMLVLSLLNPACSNPVIEKKPDKTFNMQAFNGMSADITRFEKVPAGEECRIKTW